MSWTAAPSIIWRINQVLNAAALAGTILLLVLLIPAWVASFFGASFDPHGYFLIFGFVGGVVLLAALLLLVRTALALRRCQRSGFVGQAVLGSMIGLFGAAIPSAAGWVFIGLGALFAGPAIAGIFMTRNMKRHGSRFAGRFGV